MATIVCNTITSGLKCRRRVLIALLFLVAWMGYAPPAFAHASLISSTPAAGDVFSTAPTEVQLRFNEPVSPLILKLVQPDGTAIELDQTQTMPNGLQTPLPALTQQGPHALSWRVISADGHPVGGALTFSVGTGAPSTAAHVQQPSVVRDFLIWLSRSAWYAGLFMGLGMAVCHSITGVGRRARRTGLWLLTVGGIATPLCVGLLGIDALDMPLSGLLVPTSWKTALATSFGLSAGLALMALGGATLIWMTHSTVLKRLLAGAVLLCMGAALASSGHASAAPPEWLARPSVWMHGVAVLLWVGSLLPLAYAMNDTSDRSLLRRFSRTIPIVLVVLLASGGILIYLQMTSVPALWLTAYGRVLTAKLVLVTALLALGAYNRYRLTDAALRTEPAAMRSMRRILYIECLLAVGILALVALWRFTPPPRALFTELAPSATISAQIDTKAARAELDVSLAHDQPTHLTVHLFDANGTPLTAQEVDIRFYNRSSGIEPVVFEAEPTPDGGWHIKQMELPRQDTWHVRIDALISDFERIRLETTLDETGPTTETPD